MHGDIQEEITLHVQSDRRAQQTGLDLWRQEYNTVRPHSSLAGATPEQFARIGEGARRLAPARPDMENADRNPEDLTLSP